MVSTEKYRHSYEGGVDTAENKNHVFTCPLFICQHHALSVEHGQLYFSSVIYNICMLFS